MKKEPVKVLAIVSQMNRGGLESRLMDIIRNLDFSRVQLDIYTYRLEPGVLDEEAKSYGCKIYYNKPLTFKNMFGYVQYFVDFLKQHPEYKIVHAHQDAWCSVFCKGAKKAGVPIRIAHSRTAVSTVDLKSIMKNIIKLPVGKYATHFFAVSDLAGKWLFGNKKVDAGKVEIWHNAIEASKYQYDEKNRIEKRKELQVEEKFVILHVGNFTPPKNHERIVKIFAEICKKQEDAVLLLVGREENPNIRVMVKEMGLEQKVLFLGTRTDIAELLSAGDVFLFPSIFEGMPGAVIEAQTSGLPCVISDSITREVCITKNIVQISLAAGDEIWAEQVLTQKNADREASLEQVKEAGYDIESLVKKLTEFYEDVI